MAMSLEEPLTVEAPAEQETPEAATLPVTREQSGEDAAELTSNATLVDPTIDRNTETTCQTSFGESSLSSGKDFALQLAQIGRAVKPVCH